MEIKLDILWWMFFFLREQSPPPRLITKLKVAYTIKCETIMSEDIKEQDEKNEGGQNPEEGQDPNESPASGDSGKSEGDEYKAMAEELKAENEKLSKNLSQAEYNIEKAKKEKKEAQENNDPDAVRRLEEEIKNLRSDLVTRDLQTHLSSIEDPNKRELVKHHYENTIRQTGTDSASIQADLRKAESLVEAERLKRDNAELEASVTSKNTVSGSGSTAGKKIKGDVDNRNISLSDADKALLQRRGLSAKDVKTD